MTQNTLELEDTVRAQLKSIDTFKTAVLEKLEPLAGDGSGRIYYRALLRSAPARSVVLLLQGASKGPALAGAYSGTQEQAYAELSLFFRRNNIPVPLLHAHFPGQHSFIIEDIGDTALWKLAAPADGSQAGESQPGLKALFCQAIDLLVALRAIGPEPRCAAFQRYLAFENYRREIEEFSRYYADPAGISRAAAEVLKAAFDGLCETIMSFPKVLCHFDYNAWNLFLGGEGELRVIDFQDACQASPARDLVSLINDRGMDEILGRNLHRELLEYYLLRMKAGPAFAFQYDMTLLHWDFRVTGRFINLCAKFKTDRYRQWVPGMLRRLGRTLCRANRSLHGLDDVLEILIELSPEVRNGVNDPWDFPVTQRAAQ